ncbi:MAG: cell wall-binding repeat-containing protein [Candidatus Dormibacteria bacterium]
MAGSNVSTTSVALSRATFSYAGLTDPSNANSDRFVVIAADSGQAEALAGDALARKLRTALLLTPASGLAPEVLAEVQRLNPTKAYILGGADILSPSVDSALAAAGVTPMRIAGTHPYGTAAEIAHVLGAPTSKAAVIIAGDNSSEALTAGAFAAFERLPLLMVSHDSIPAETEQALSALGIARTIAVGSSATISDGCHNPAHGRRTQSHARRRQWRT